MLRQHHAQCEALRAQQHARREAPSALRQGMRGASPPADRALSPAGARERASSAESFSMMHTMREAGATVPESDDDNSAPPAAGAGPARGGRGAEGARRAGGAFGGRGAPAAGAAPASLDASLDAFDFEALGAQGPARLLLARAALRGRCHGAG